MHASFISILSISVGRILHVDFIPNDHGKNVDEVNHFAAHRSWCCMRHSSSDYVNNVIRLYKDSVAWTESHAAVTFQRGRPNRRAWVSGCGTLACTMLPGGMRLCTHVAMAIDSVVAAEETVAVAVVSAIWVENSS